MILVFIFVPTLNEKIQCKLRPIQVSNLFNITENWNKDRLTYDFVVGHNKVPNKNSKKQPTNPFPSVSISFNLPTKRLISILPCTFGPCYWHIWFISSALTIIDTSTPFKFNPRNIIHLQWISVTFNQKYLMHTNLRQNYQLTICINLYLIL